MHLDGHAQNCLVFTQTAIHDFLMAFKYNHFRITTNVLGNIGLWYADLSPFKNAIGKTILTLSTFLILLLLILEHVYALLSYSKDKMEFLKTVGTIAFHSVALVRNCLFYIALPKIEVILQILHRDSIKLDQFYILPTENDNEHIQIIDFGEKSGRTDLVKRCNWLIERANFFSLVFYGITMLMGIQSLTFSYVNAIIFPLKEFDSIQNLTTTSRVMPYNHYTLLDGTKTYNFYLETGFQCLVISYMAFAYISKYLCWYF